MLLPKKLVPLFKRAQEEAPASGLDSLLSLGAAGPHRGSALEHRTPAISIQVPSFGGRTSRNAWRLPQLTRISQASWDGGRRRASGAAVQ
jgi:hypothetical protein